MRNSIVEYKNKLNKALDQLDVQLVEDLTVEFSKIWNSGNRLFFCGNGGSAGNAIHLANDFLYGVSKGKGKGMRVTAIPSNQAVMTCLANDIGYEYVFSEYLRVHGEENDILVILSGSGNSPNILKAIEQAKSMRIKSFAILGYSGGKALHIVDKAIHINIDDMQIAEDMQLIVGHMVMQLLCDENGVDF